MKTMRSMLLLAAVVLVAPFTRAQVPSSLEVPPDIGVVAQVDLPGAGDYDLYDFGLSAILQFRDWVSYPWGYALNLGFGEWTVNRNANNPGSGLYDFSGTLEVVPFGGSIIYSLYDDGPWRILADAGLRYVAIDSKITARQTGEGSTRYGVDVEDAFLYTLSTGVEYIFSPDVSWSLGLGYQSDITKGEVSTSLVKARDSIMESFFLTAALRFNL